MKKHKSNAEKQRAYRDRKRNAKPTNVTPILEPDRRVTKDPRYGDANYQFICTLNGEPFFARVTYNGMTHEEAMERQGLGWTQGASAAAAPAKTAAAAAAAAAAEGGAS